MAGDAGANDWGAEDSTENAVVATTTDVGDNTGPFPFGTAVFGAAPVLAGATTAAGGFNAGLAPTHPGGSPARRGGRNRNRQNKKKGGRRFPTPGSEPGLVAPGAYVPTQIEVAPSLGDASDGELIVAAGDVVVLPARATPYQYSSVTLRGGVCSTFLAWALIFSVRGAFHPHTVHCIDPNR